ncbi:MAG: hypothetical protein KDB03_19180 [Planctomycetales bacterium]|nr:hypothetical protein [Planctomycetales bacterium]
MKTNTIRTYALGAASGAIVAQILRPGVLEILIALAFVIAISIFWQRRGTELKQFAEA